ncbi:MAG: DUF2807 domain-containing protein [Bacteroidia bacterium]|nr:DUF2807 domain-containing protein [Bacteroidia bacterium]
MHQTRTFILQHLKSFIYASIWCLLILGISSCKDTVEDCFKSTGSIAREERFVSDFDSIRLEDNVNIILIQDTLNKVIIEAGENLIPKIRSTVENRALILKNENHCNWVRKLNVPVNAYVHFKDISALNNLGVADITNQDTINIKGHAIDIRILGSGDIRLNGNFDWIYGRVLVSIGNLYLSGKSGGLELYCDGTSLVRAENLETQFASVETYLPGDVYVNAKEQLSAKIYWEGNVYYRNNPQIVYKKETSTGRLIQIP